MKFSDGFWMRRPGVSALFAEEAYTIDHVESVDQGSTLRVTAPTKVIGKRGDTLNRPVLTTIISSPMEGVIRIRIEHFAGARTRGGFSLPGAVVGGAGSVRTDAAGGYLESGPIVATVAQGSPWMLDFLVNGERVTGSGPKSQAYLRVADNSGVETGIPTSAVSEVGVPRASSFVHEQLDLSVGELIYGLGERFGPLVKNGQTVEIWNADSGTASEQAYKSIPFYLSSKGYGVLVNDPGHVSFEVGSEAVERVQFSVSGEALEYFVIAGPTPKDVLTRYTQLTGRPPVLPAWSYGLWLSTSFTTDYDEGTVSGFIDEMARRELPISVFHFDCFWMREFNWCDFEWDSRVFPDPEGMLARLHTKDIRISVWINPYIGQRSPLFPEAQEAGYLVKRPDGSVWQWDNWQAGMGLVDFTNPDAVSWFQSHLRRLVGQGVDCFKTDFAERIPTDVMWADGSDPERMHNLYSSLYNRAVHDVLVGARGANDAVLFARSGTVGGQSMPVHWGGDSTSSFDSMAETLRGGLSLALSGFAHWSHDIGGFEGTPDPEVFKRWVAFGLLSSHSRFHGSETYRVPWNFDEEAVEVTRVFTHLKMRLMPYIYQAGVSAAENGIPVLRPMQLEFPGDPAAAYLDRQYMLGADILVAPVFSADGSVDYYLPGGTWTNLLTGEAAEGGLWRREVHDVFSLPLWVREDAVLPWGYDDSRPDYDYLEKLTLVVYPGKPGVTVTTVTMPAGGSEQFTVERTDTDVRVRASSGNAQTFTVTTPGGPSLASQDGEVRFVR